jgi:hypothetical protein
MFREAMISSTTATLACQLIGAASTWPVASAAPTTLVTLPPGVSARFLANRSGIAFGRLAATPADPATIRPNWPPA